MESGQFDWEHCEMSSHAEILSNGKINVDKTNLKHENESGVAESAGSRS